MLRLRSLRLLPLGRLLLMAIVAGGAAAIPALVSAASADTVVGYVESAHAIPNRGGALLEVVSPAWKDGRRLVTVEAPAVALVGRWIVAQGVSRDVGGTRVLMATATPSLPLLGEPMVGDLLADGARALHAAVGDHQAALVLAFALLLARGLLLRLTGGAVLGAAVAALAWHALILGNQAGWFTAGADACTTATAGAGLLGLLLGLRGRGFAAVSAQRAVLAGVLLLLGDRLAGAFGWPPQAATIAAVALPLLSIPAACALLIGLLASVGVSATVPAANALLAASALAVHVLTGGRWLEGWSRPPRRWVAA